MGWKEAADFVGEKAVDWGVKFLKLPNVVGTVAKELLFPEPVGIEEARYDWRKAERERIIKETLDALEKLPVNKPVYKKNKPVAAPPKDAPPNETPAPVDQPSFKLPERPNALPIDPFWIPRELIKRTRPISGRSLTKHKFGIMECHPISYAKEPVFTVVHDTIGTGRRKENAKKGTKNFIGWFIRENGNLDTRMIYASESEGGMPITDNILWDQVAYITPQDPGDWTGPLSFQFGAASIMDEAADYASSRQNVALGGSRPVIYWNKPKIKIKKSGDVEISDRFTSEGLTNLAADIKFLLEYYSNRKIKHLSIVNSSHGSVKKAVGADDFPLIMPRSLCDHEADQLKEFAKEEIKILKEQLSKTKDYTTRVIIQKTIEAKELELAEIDSGYIKYNQVFSHTELQAAIIEMFAELAGVYPLKIDIEPGHLLTQTLGPKPNKTKKAGKQDATDNDRTDPQELFEVKTQTEPIKLRFPNMGETQAEMLQILLNMQGMQNLQQEFLNRLAAQSCSTQAALIETHNKVDAIFDWAGFKVENQKDYYTLAFDPMIASDPENDELLKYLIGRNVEIRKPVFAVDKENQTVTASQFWYNRAATIIQNVHYRKFTGKEGSHMRDPKTFLTYAKNLMDTMGFLDGVSLSDDNKRVTLSFEDFKKLFTEGFSDITKEPKDDNKPWNEDKDNRPLFKDDKVATIAGKRYGTPNGTT